MELADKIRWLTELVVTDPLAAARELERVAEQCLALAAELRSRAEGGPRDRGGAGDRVRLAVRGPDGSLKRRIDTGGSN